MKISKNVNITALIIVLVYGKRTFIAFANLRLEDLKSRLES